MKGSSGVRIGGAAAAVLIGCLAAMTGPGELAAQAPNSPGDWTSHNYDLSNRRYAPLDQISTSSVGSMRLAWSFQVRASNISQVTPLVINGVMYFHSPSTTFALDAATGIQLWSVPMESGAEGTGPVRGATYGSRRVYVYRGATLYALDAETGQRVESFGRNGVLSVVEEALRFKYPSRFPTTLEAVDVGYRLTTPPAYYDGTLYVAAALSEGHIPGGLVIAIDAVSGALKWVFNTIPQQPGDEGWEIARDTWGKGARAGGGIWTQPAIDPELGMVYVNAGNPSPAYDGSARNGTNLFTNSTLALDMKTGRLRWHYQAVHHDLWDWDHVTGPVLFDVTRDGRTIKGVGAAGKNCLLYLWNRETGVPLHPIVETPVPTETDVPDQKIWPTQPIPYNARGVPMTPFCATFVNLENAALANQARPMYTPYSVREPYIVAHGGSSFGSPSFSPLTGLLYVTGKNGAISLKVKPIGDVLKPGPDSRGHDESFVEINRLSDAYTPTETVSAYDPRTGEQVWQQVLPAVSSIGSSGNLVTAGNLVFQGIGARGFYAFDARTGAQLFKYETPRSVRATPLTYLVSGRQYVAVVATDTVLTFRLP